MNKDNTEQEMAEWKEICHKLHLRDETVDGTDEQAMIRNHYLKWFTPKTNNKDNTVEEIILNICKRDGYSDAEANDVLAVFYSEPAIVEALTTYAEQVRREEITEDTSDGCHTFKELYQFRLLYNAHLFNEWAKQGKYGVHKSQRHSDGELCFGRDDYFIVVATLPTGQISNHYRMSDWDLFKCEAVEKAKHHWDGHTSQDVAQRLLQAFSEDSV